jgi:hypothetical protein
MAWALLCVMGLSLVQAQRPLPATYRYNVEGRWIGPEIRLDSADHPLHHAHRRRLSEENGADAIRVLGPIALTSASGTVANDIGQPSGTKVQLSAFEDIYGPHEAGFSSRQDFVIVEQMGCPTPSLCYSDGGVDTKTAQVRARSSQYRGAPLGSALTVLRCVRRMSVRTRATSTYRVSRMGSTMAFSTTAEGTPSSTTSISPSNASISTRAAPPTPQWCLTHPWLSAAWCTRPPPWGWHTKSASCCPCLVLPVQVARGVDEVQTPLYGKWEDYSTGLLPTLDACGGHFGPTPDSGDEWIYHNHVQDGPPFTFGCYGPTADQKCASASTRPPPAAQYDPPS